jgi:hypothetical protein
MDIVSLLVGFLVGAFTGAAGTYLGNKFTDKRRASELKATDKNNWNNLF